MTSNDILVRYGALTNEAFKGSEPWRLRYIVIMNNPEVSHRGINTQEGTQKLFSLSHRGDLRMFF